MANSIHIFTHMEAEETKILNRCIFEGDLAQVKAIVSKGIDLNSEELWEGWYPILMAVEHSSHEILRYLIEHGADVNIDYGRPLGLSLDVCIDCMAQSNLDKPKPEWLETVRILMEHGADPSLRDKKGDRPIDMIPIYCSSIDGQHELKSFFRELIPEIDFLLPLPPLNTKQSSNRPNLFKRVYRHFVSSLSRFGRGLK